MSQKSLDYTYRGSANQKIIDVPSSLKSGKAEYITKYDKKYSDS